jgi:hypothetical protein
VQNLGTLASRHQDLLQASRHVRTVGLLQGPDFLFTEVDVEHCHGVGKVVGLGGSHDGSTHDRVVQHPCQRDMRHRDVTGLGDLLYGVDDGATAVDVEPPADGVGVEAVGVFTPRAPR